MARIRQVDESEATGLLQRIYVAAKQRAGKVANIIRLSSLDAATTHSSLQFYVRLMKTKNSLNASDREMIATVVSNANGCFY